MRDTTDLDSGVKPRNDTYKNVRNKHINNVHKMKTGNNVRKIKNTPPPVVIPGLDPGIQVMVQIKMSLWDNGDHPAPG